MDEKSLERIPRFSWGEIKKHLEAKAPFEVISPMASALIRVKRYEPLIALAIHAGHRVREEMTVKMSIEEDERLHEEDVHVEQFIAEAPIQMIGLDSRFEYDVNRPRGNSVYLKPMESWGKKVWRTPPSKDELEISYQKYDEFHELLEFIVETITGYFPKPVILDLHSYNYRRQSYNGKENSLPVLNLGTTALDRKKHAKSIDRALSDLAAIKLPGVPMVVKENDVFKGNGAVAKAMASKFPESLLLNIEIKKVYMNEENGDFHPAILNALKESLHKFARTTMEQFAGFKST
ncbi:MAG TPA: N-formylglutamate amidohydrolase [Bdellovibrionota bacterium]|nr:N-formylglutamate amidohydrolase [Bdellovibrionota bacterium]